MQNYKKLLLFLTILAIGVYYVNKKTHWITNRTYQLVDVTKPSITLLHKMKGQEHVFGFFVHITGHIEGKGRVKLSYPNSNTKSYKIEDISGDVDIKWGGDWYADVLEIKYEPIANVKSGVLSFEYAFDGV